MVLYKISAFYKTNLILILWGSRHQRPVTIFNQSLASNNMAQTYIAFSLKKRNLKHFKRTLKTIVNSSALNKFCFAKQNRCFWILLQRFHNDWVIKIIVETRHQVERQNCWLKWMLPACPCGKHERERIRLGAPINAISWYDSDMNIYKKDFRTTYLSLPMTVALNLSGS